MPYEFVDALSHADFVLSMFENFSSEDRPPEWMWPFGELVNSHFEQVAERRRSGDSDLPPAGFTGDGDPFGANVFAGQQLSDAMRG